MAYVRTYYVCVYRSVLTPPTTHPLLAPAREHRVQAYAWSTAHVQSPHSLRPVDLHRMTSPVRCPAPPPQQKTTQNNRQQETEGVKHCIHSRYVFRQLGRVNSAAAVDKLFSKTTRVCLQR